MRRFRVVDRADIAAIEALPYAEFMRHRSIGSALEDVASCHGGRPAMVFLPSADIDEQPIRWTHAELLQRVRGAAQVFARLADGAPRVALLLPAIPQAYVALWGAEVAGMVCPINYLLDGRHVATLIRASGANILVALGANAELDIASRLVDIRVACPSLRHVLIVGGGPGEVDFDACLDEACCDAPALPDDGNAHRAAALFHTGGTTGEPKLAQHTHGNQLHAAWGAAQVIGMTEHEVTLNAFPIFHVAGPLVYGLSTLLAGGCMVLPTLLGMRNAAFVARYWQFVERERVTLLAGVPTMLSMLLAVDPAGAHTLGVRALLTGGAPLPTALAERFEQRFAIPVRSILGMTECAGAISAEPVAAPRIAGSCGLPLPFTSIAVADATGVEPSSACKTGVLRVRGPNVMRGYLEDRHDTTEPDGWLSTGDIGHVDEAGRIFVTGRAKDLIIRGGHNIDPCIIEEALLAHPAVHTAAAVGQPDEYAGELPVAFVLLKPGAAVEPGELATFVGRVIPERPACPKRIDVLDAMPLTAIGKVYKPALRLLAMERVVTERLASAGLQDQVQVRGTQDGSRLGVVFLRAPGHPHLPSAERIDSLMAGFAFPHRAAFLEEVDVQPDGLPD